MARAPREALPEFAPPTVEVQTEALGLSAAEVEQLITVPLEQDLLIGIAFLDKIESVSLPGLSSVVMTFEPDTDLLDARQVVQERLTQAVGVAGLPAVAKPPQMIQPLSSLPRVAIVELSSEQLSQIDMSVLSRWVIGPRLMGVPGVANVAIWGNRDRQLQVLVDPERLRQNDTTLSEVIRTAGNALEVSPLTYLEASKPGTGGFIDTENQRLNIFHEQVISSPEELAQVPLDRPGRGPADGEAVTLGDITEVVESHQPLIGDAVCADGSCLLLVVEKFPGANTGEVTAGVESALAALRPGLGDIRVDTSVYRPADFVDSTFDRLGWVLLAGLALLLAAVVAVFRDWRRSVVTVVTTGVSAASAVLVLTLRGAPVTFMVAAGLLLGLTAVVYDSVTDAHHLAARVPHGPAGRPARWGAVVRAAAERRGSLMFAVLVVVAAALPLFFVRGEGGPFLPPLAASYLLAVGMSVVVALLLTPGLALVLLPRREEQVLESPAERWAHRVFDRAAPAALSRPGVALAVAAVLALAGLGSIPLLTTSLQPAVNERTLLVHVEAAPGTSLPRMTAVTEEILQELRAVPGVTEATGHVGRAVMSDEVVDVNSGEIWVTLAASTDYAEGVGAVEQTAAGYPELRTEVLTYAEERIDATLGDTGRDLTVRVYGEDAVVRATKAEEIRGLLSGVRGIRDPTVDAGPGQRTLEVRVDLRASQSHGLKPGDVRRAAASLVGGITVGNLFEEQKVFDVVVWGAPQVRDSVADLEQLLVDTPSGPVPLGAVADVRTVDNPVEIRHEAAASYLDVTADVTGRDVADVADEVSSAVRAVDFPLDHHAEMVGRFAEQADARDLVAAIALATLVGVFLLLQAAFGSWRLASLALALLPVALSGGLVAVLVSGRTVTLGTVTGLLAALGLAVRPVVVTIRRYQQLARVGGPERTHEAVLAGTRENLVPTALSAVAVAALVLPAVVVGAVPGLELVHAGTVVVLGSLLTTLVVALYVMPALCLRLGVAAGDQAVTEDLLDSLPQQRAQEPVRDAALQRGSGRTRRRLARAGLWAAPALLLGSCGGTITDSYVIDREPAHVEIASGSGPPRVLVDGRAIERLGIRTSPVQEAAGSLVVPTAAVIVATDGTWWVYTSPEKGVYVRQEVAVASHQGATTVLSSGPPAGTQVVTVGVAEVAGIEDGVGH